PRHHTPQRRGCRGQPTAPQPNWMLGVLSFALLEMAQVRRRLILLLRHQETVAADEVDLLVNGDVDVVLDAVVLLPGDVLGAPLIVLHHRPRPRQRVVGRGYFVVKDVWVRPVEIETLPDDGLVVIGHRHAGQVPLVWTADVARLDLERVVAAAAIAIDPSTDRVTGKGRL